MKISKFIHILITLCLFQVTVYGVQDVIINLNVHKITINCETNIKIAYDNNIYENNHDFFVADKSTLKVEIKPEKGCSVKTIISNNDCDIYFENNYLIISNVRSNLTLDITAENDNVVQKITSFIQEITSSLANNNDKEFVRISCENKLISNALTEVLDEIEQKTQQKVVERKNNSYVLTDKFSNIIINKTLNGRCRYQSCFK